MDHHPRAAIVFAATAMELAVKTVLLRPIVYGLVHDESVAEFVTELTTQHTRGIETFKKLLTAILKRLGGIGSTPASPMEQSDWVPARRHAPVAGTPGDDRQLSRWGIELH